MTQGDALKRYLEAGIALTQMTRERAEAIVRELVKAGEVQREHAQERVDELIDRGRKSSDTLMDMVRSEIAKQLAAMGLATRDDLAALEARLAGRGSGPAAPESPRSSEPGSPESAATSSEPSGSVVDSSLPATKSPGSPAESDSTPSPADTESEAPSADDVAAPTEPATGEPGADEPAAG